MSKTRSPVTPVAGIPRPLGRTDLRVTPIAVGGAPLGSMPDAFGYGVPPWQGVETVVAALDGPINFLDTAAVYSDGESERRIGSAIAQHGLPEGFVVATKVDPHPRTGDYSGAQVRRSADQSRGRLGLEQLPLLYLHDMERLPFETAVAAGGPVDSLLQLKVDGIARHLGVAGGPIELMLGYIRTGHFDVVITHNRWTLLDQSAEALLTEAHAAGVAVVNAAPFGGGFLSRGPEQIPTYAYETASSQLLETATAMRSLCEARGVPLAAAALQFSMRDPRITSTIVGMSNPARIADTIRLAKYEIDDDLWDKLDAIAPPPETWLY